jgi:O-antigen biosynthesis protein
VVWVTSTHEAELLRQVPGLPRVEVVPNIHRVREDVPGPRGRTDVLFVGGFRHPPNEDAVLYFVRDVLPRVIARRPETRLIVIGSDVTPRIRKLAGPHVEVRGFVQDLQPLFDSARLSIAPLRYGAGVKGKITHSLAWGLPVVTTPIGAEGLGLVDGEHVLIGADPEDLATHIIELLDDDLLWLRLSHGGRECIRACAEYYIVRSRVADLLCRTKDHAATRNVC